MKSTLKQVARSMTGPFAFCGIAVQRGTRDPVFVTKTAEGIDADAATLFRAASVSKIVVGQSVVLAAAKIGVKPPFTQDIGDILGYPLRHPDFPDQPITLNMLLSHTAGLTDAAGYDIPADRSLADFLTQTTVFGPHQPGTHFTYANLGYVILAAAIEVMSGQRFDRFVHSDALAPLEITGGFNWSGVATRRNTLSTYRHDGRGLVAQIDATVPAHGVIGPSGRPEDLTRYVAGHNPSLFSPAGGLRISLHGMLTLAQTLASRQATPLWSPWMGGHENPDGAFESYGIGLQYFDDPPFYPRPLIGHFGNAYGFRGGVWYDPAADMSFAYALNGARMDAQSDAFLPEEVTILETIASFG